MVVTGRSQAIDQYDDESNNRDEIDITSEEEDTPIRPPQDTTQEAEGNDYGSPVVITARPMIPTRPL